MLHRTHRHSENEDSRFSGRRRALFSFVMVCMSALVVRAVHLQVYKKEYLQEHSRFSHIVTIPSYRGSIEDRNGEPLAISSPAPSIILSPKELEKDDEMVLAAMHKKYRHDHDGRKLTDADKEFVLAQYHQDKAGKIKQLEQLLGIPGDSISQVLVQKKGKGFVYLAKKINPDLAEKVKELQLSGIDVHREFKRFYPSGEVTAQLVGFTDAENVGQVGLEKNYETLLKGIDGKKRVIRDGKRQVIADLESINAPTPGKDLLLSIDQRIQYLAYKELQDAYRRHKAKSATAVVLDANTGEILAAVSQPSFNPNSKKDIKESLYRNRVFTDVFEPGSTVKPFVVAAALEGRYIRPHDIFATAGTYEVGGHAVHDVHNYGVLDVEGVLKKSSNIGVTRMALKMPAEYFCDSYSKYGFGVSTATGFPGEAIGKMPGPDHLGEFERATLSFGYGLNVSALQLARAYTALADDGVLHSVSLLKRDEDVDARRVMSKRTAKTVRTMMESVISKDGTAYEARVDGYRVAGKTGTVKKAGARGYTPNSYFAVFAGLAPASDPRLIVVVMIDEPSSGDYYGGLVSAPVFSKITGGALRMLGVAPDQENTMPLLLAKKGVRGG
jgi:cell division protein FtsI (penicillin-binding protein 3)